MAEAIDAQNPVRRQLRCSAQIGLNWLLHGQLRRLRTQRPRHSLLSSLRTSDMIQTLPQANEIVFMLV